MIASVVITLLVFDIALACQPVRIHYQSTYCRSNVAAIIKIDSRDSERVFAAELVYRGTVMGVLKGDQLREGLNVTVKTAGPANSCGPTILGVGNTYMILGNQEGENTIGVPVFNGARAIPDKATERKLRRRIALYEASRCLCNVRTFFYGRRRPGMTAKPYECVEPMPWNRCIWQEGACHSKNGVCTWVSNCRSPRGPPQ